MLTLRDAMNGPSNSYSSGVVALGPGSGVPRAAREGVELTPTFVSDLHELIESGVLELSLQNLGGTLRIRAHDQLTPQEYTQVPSDGFCVLTFATPSGKLIQFEIDLGRGIVTVARKLSLQNGQKRGFMSCLGHMDTMNFLSELVHQARLQVARREVEVTATIDESARQTGEQVHAVLGA